MTKSRADGRIMATISFDPLVLYELDIRLQNQSMSRSDYINIVVAADILTPGYIPQTKLRAQLPKDTGLIYETWKRYGQPHLIDLAKLFGCSVSALSIRLNEYLKDVNPDDLALITGRRNWDNRLIKLDFHEND